LQAGRTPARGGIVDEAVLGLAAVAEAPVGEATLAEPLAAELTQATEQATQALKPPAVAPATEQSTMILAPGGEANGAGSPSGEQATREIKRPDA
jgi:hypothetical protein